MNAKLTAKETALMTAIAENYFSFFDGGLVAHDSGIWTDTMTGEIVSTTQYDISTSQRGAASVVNSLGRKGLLTTSTNEDGAWTELTEAGQAWVEAHNATTEEAPATEAPAIQLSGEMVEVPSEALANLTAAAEAIAEAVVTEEAPAAPVATLADFPAGTEVLTRDGKQWTVVGPAQNNTTLKLVDGDKKTTFRFPHNITKA